MKSCPDAHDNAHRLRNPLAPLVGARKENAEPSLGTRRLKPTDEYGIDLSFNRLVPTRYLLLASVRSHISAARYDTQVAEGDRTIEDCGDPPSTTEMKTVVRSFRVPSGHAGSINGG